MSARSATAIFAGDGAHGVDVLVDERERNARHLRRMLEQPAKALGDAGHRGIAERGGLALDVVRGAEQLLVRLLGEALAHDVLARRFEAFAFGVHPGGELGSKAAPAPLRRARPDRHRRLPQAVTALRTWCGGVITSWSA